MIARKIIRSSVLGIGLPILCLWMLVLPSCGGTGGMSTTTRAPWTQSGERARFREDLIRSTIEASLAKRPSVGHESSWESAFWAMELALYTSDGTDAAIREAFSGYGLHSPSFQRSLLEVVYALYPDRFLAEMDSVSRTTTSEKLFAMSVRHLLRGGVLPPAAAQERMSVRFPSWQHHAVLRCLKYDIMTSGGLSPSLPSLVELLSYTLPDRLPVIFSFQRRDRRYEGRAVVRKQDGTFARASSGEYFSIGQLALASSNLPGYLTNGNTPQGVLSVQGFDVSRNEFIGPTTNIQLVLPYEVSPAIYFHGGAVTDTGWTLERYLTLLPPTWRENEALHEAYYAGQAGRTEIIAHGTTIDPEFYRGRPYYPNTPSLGCLTAPEQWSPETGMLLSSEQQRLIDVLKTVGFERGYLIVVNIDASMSAVSTADISPLLSGAEALLRR